MKQGKIPLGRDTDYPDNYAPTLLCPIPRAAARGPLGIAEPLPFSGSDIWNAWELTWLGGSSRPTVATAEIIVPADSANIVESKSLKLYLNSFAMSRFSSDFDVAETLRKDLMSCVGSPVIVNVLPVVATEARITCRLAGSCLDTLDVVCGDWEVDANLLCADSNSIVTEDVHTHLLRSLCPVTAQPDVGSVQVSYRGPKIDHASLLKYVVSYRRHNDFHEACVERMFVDILRQCSPERLSIHARYQRRGGIDINPFRSNDPGELPLNLRLWRQ
ncbi:MAG: NADPH-dependent 7-cyano-7-deazaguanine reductase QueF [Woeseiaceae bacterium]